MVVVWLLNSPIGIVGEKLFNKTSQSGGWIDLTFYDLKPYIDKSLVELHILSPIKNNNRHIEYFKGCFFHYIRWNNKIGKKPTKKDNDRMISILKTINPNLIMTWGTEFSFTFSGLICSHELSIPSLIYIQGLINSFKEYENANLKYTEMLKSLNLFEKWKIIQTKLYYNSLKKQIKYENEMFKKCSGIISDNYWCFEIAKSINFNINCYFSLLPIDKEFTKAKKWKLENINRYQIFTIAGRTSYKGLHNLIKALSIVKKEYPNVRLIIPGNIGYKGKNILKKPPYICFLEYLINKNGLTKNIVFSGKLTHKEMSEFMAKSHCFVMPSCVENHSSTVREALYVGVPTITSLVGSISELIENNSQSLLYRYDDIYALALNIKKVFSSDELCSKLSKNGSQRIVEFYNKTGDNSIFDIYNKVVK